MKGLSLKLSDSNTQKMIYYLKSGNSKCYSIPFYVSLLLLLADYFTKYLFETYTENHQKREKRRNFNFNQNIP
jgi:hypothetical protein